MKQLANKLEAVQPALTHAPAIFENMRLVLSQLSKDRDSLDPKGKDLLDVLTSLSTARSEKLREEIANTDMPPSHYADFTGWGR